MVLPVTVRRSERSLPCFQLPHHGWHAAGAVEALAQEFPGRLHVQQQRHVVAMLHPVAGVQFHAGMARHGHRCALRVGGAADGRVDHDGVEKASRVRMLDGRRSSRHLDDALPGGIGHLAALAVGRGNGRAARQRHAQRLGQRVHGRGRAHGVAVAGRRRRGGGDLQEFVVDLAGGQLAAAFPDGRARTDQLALDPAVQHGAAGQHDGGNVDRGGGHQLRGVVLSQPVVSTTASIG
jgi:hypothetical protein